MDVFEKLNKAFAGWYESWFGDGAGDIRPKDVLRKIIAAMEDNRKEGLDNRVYVPNKYVLALTFANDEEREYLLAFLEKVELEAALRKYMNQNKYHMRGPLDMTIEEITPEEGEDTPEKMRVKCKWDVGPIEREPDEPAYYAIPELAEAVEEEEEYTVAATDMYDAGTVSPPVLRAKHGGGQFFLSKPVNMIGRSRRLNNDVVLEMDGMVSKRHASVTHTPDGWKIVDLNSTNGVWVNGERVESRVLSSGDVVLLGATEMVFEEPGGRPVQVVERGESARPRLVIDRGGVTEEFRLPSETTIGRALTNDIRFGDPSVAQRHAKIVSRDGHFHLEDLGSGAGAWVNGTVVGRGSSVRLRPGDTITLGEVEVRFELD